MRRLTCQSNAQTYTGHGWSIWARERQTRHTHTRLAS
jgi:hypothetical protein